MHGVSNGPGALADGCPGVPELRTDWHDPDADLLVGTFLFELEYLAP